MCRIRCRPVNSNLTVVRQERSNKLHANNNKLHANNTAVTGKTDPEDPRFKGSSRIRRLVAALNTTVGIGKVLGLGAVPYTATAVLLRRCTAPSVPEPYRTSTRRQPVRYGSGTVTAKYGTAYDSRSSRTTAGLTAYGGYGGRSGPYRTVLVRGWTRYALEGPWPPVGKVRWSVEAGEQNGRWPEPQTAWSTQSVRDDFDGGVYETLRLRRIGTARWSESKGMASVKEDKVTALAQLIVHRDFA
ncbi:hypothetical protein C8F01DRAFT_1229096 [Mycena amicta]|nr:hypothetical protein C8F01DRAFT_1229096 [Mycena amicta]